MNNSDWGYQWQRLRKGAIDPARVGRESVALGQTILVTGGAGYVGSHVCKSLAAEGFNPVAVDSLCRGHESAVKWGSLERVDLTDAARLKGVIEQHRPAGVMHLADLCDVGESVMDPAKYYHNNLVGSLNLLKGMLEQGIGSIIFSSSCAVYGVPGKVPISETQANVPITPYGVSKLVVEHMLQDFSMAYGIGYVCLRYFNAAGADPDGEIGESHRPETHIIPLAIKTALGERSSFEIFGTDYATPDGTAVRDYVHVSDLASAHLLALRHLLGGGRSAALNLGTGRGHSVKQIVAAVERLSGRAVPVKEGPRRTGDPSVLGCRCLRGSQGSGLEAATQVPGRHHRHCAELAPQVPVRLTDPGNTRAASGIPMDFVPGWKDYSILLQFAGLFGVSGWLTYRLAVGRLQDPDGTGTLPGTRVDLFKSLISPVLLSTVCGLMVTSFFLILSAQLGVARIRYLFSAVGSLQLGLSCLPVEVGVSSMAPALPETAAAKVERFVVGGHPAARWVHLRKYRRIYRQPKRSRGACQHCGASGSGAALAFQRS